MRVGQQVEDVHGRKFELVAISTTSSDSTPTLPDNTIERILSKSEAAAAGDGVNIPLVPGGVTPESRNWKLGNLRFTRVS